MVTPHFLAPMLKDSALAWSLVHEASGRVIASDLRTAFDSASRREGLLKQSAWPVGAALIIAPCQAVHTVGMRFAIDVVFVDRSGRVVQVREQLPTWRLAGTWRAFAAIEFRAGALAGAVRKGDALILAGSAAALTVNDA